MGVVPLVAAAGLALVGCSKEEVRTYSAPKEPAKTASAQAPVAAAPVTQSSMHWQTPAGWQEQPASGMRLGSFKVSKDGQQADISIIPLGGISGSELDNVNRWRGQVGLEPLDAAKLAEAGEKVLIGTTTAALYDLGGTDPQTKQPARILAAILPGEGTTWFFKMTGPDALVAQEKGAFKELLKSVHFDAAPHGEQAHPSAQSPAELKDLFYKMLGNEQLVGQQKDSFNELVPSARYPHAS
jgi:hypothetical protein